MTKRKTRRKEKTTTRRGNKHIELNARNKSKENERRGIKRRRKLEEDS